MCSVKWCRKFDAFDDFQEKKISLAICSRVARLRSRFGPNSDVWAAEEVHSSAQIGENICNLVSLRLHCTSLKISTIWQSGPLSNICLSGWGYIHCCNDEGPFSHKSINQIEHMEQKKVKNATSAFLSSVLWRFLGCILTWSGGDWVLSGDVHSRHSTFPGVN